MAATRRPPLPARRRAILPVAPSAILLVAGLAACTTPGPDGAPTSSGADASASTPAAGSPTASPPAPSGATGTSTTPTADAPLVLLGLPTGDGDGVIWWSAEPGTLTARTRLTTDPAIDLRAGPDGSLLATSGRDVFVGRVDGSGLAPVERWTVDRPVAPACLDASGRPVVADAETLELSVIEDGKLVPLTDLPFATGTCAPLADGRTSIAVDGGGLWAVASDGRAQHVHGAAGHQLSGGGQRIVRTDPTAEAGEAVVHEATVGPDGRLGREIGRVSGEGERRLASATLSGDGAWLGVTLLVTRGDDRSTQIALYRVTDAGLIPVAEMATELGARLVVQSPP